MPHDIPQTHSSFHLHRLHKRADDRQLRLRSEKEKRRGRRGEENYILSVHQIKKKEHHGNGNNDVEVDCQKSSCQISHFW